MNDRVKAWKRWAGKTLADQGNGVCLDSGGKYNSPWPTEMCEITEMTWSTCLAAAGEKQKRN